MATTVLTLRLLFDDVEINELNQIVTKIRSIYTNKDVIYSQYSVEDLVNDIVTETIKITDIFEMIQKKIKIGET